MTGIEKLYKELGPKEQQWLVYNLAKLLYRWFNGFDEFNKSSWLKLQPPGTRPETSLR